LGRPLSFALKIFALGVVSGTSAAAQEECKSIIDDQARLACFDLAYGVRTIAPTDGPSPGKWQKSVQQSALTDEKTVVLRLSSDDEIRGQFGDTGPATLILRCLENTTSAYFLFNDHFLADIQGYGKVDYRLDQNTMRSANMDVSTDNKALGLWSGGKSIPFLKAMLGHSTMVVRATPFNESSVTVTFDISGIDGAIQELRDTCHW
jgi:type VI secretion system protein VasI